MSHALMTKGKGFYSHVSLRRGKVQNKPDRNKLECIGWINRNDWSNKSKWLVESIEMIGRINQTRSKSIEVIDRTIEVNRTQSKIYIFFRLWLISIVWSINLIVWSINSIVRSVTSIEFDRFDRSIRPINSIAFDWVRSIRSTIEFDCVQLTSPGFSTTGLFWFYFANWQLNESPTLAWH